MTNGKAPSNRTALSRIYLGSAFAGLVGAGVGPPGSVCAALVLCVALGLYDGLFEERRGFNALALVAGATGAGLVAAVTRSRGERELASVRSIVEMAQRVLLRPVPLTAGPLEAACRTPRRLRRCASAVTCTRWWPRRTESG